MQNNANQAWSERNSANVTWNDWTSKTNDSNPDAFEMNGMVALWQQLPITSGSPFSGSYQLQSSASNLDLTVPGSGNAAPVVQAADAGDASSWTFVPESNGYYEIKNVESGQVLNVSGASGALGAKVVQWPAGSIRAGNDQWYPVHNADGTWSFYNRNSQLALDDPAATTATGTQYEQWAQNNSAAQEFSLLPRAGGSGGTPAAGAVRGPGSPASVWTSTPVTPQTEPPPSCGIATEQ